MKFPTWYNTCEHFMSNKKSAQKISLMIKCNCLIIWMSLMVRYFLGQRPQIKNIRSTLNYISVLLQPHLFDKVWLWCQYEREDGQTV